MGESTVPPGAGSAAPEAPAGGEALTRGRERLGLTVDQFAAELGVTPHIVEAWERGALAMPPRYRQALAYRLALADREAALAASGLPDCEWFRAWESTEVPPTRGAWARHMHAGRQHAAICQVCIARDRFLREHFPPLPPAPVPRWFALLRRFSAWLGTFPDWVRPAIVGALLAGGLTTIRVLLSVRTIARDGAALLGAVTAIVFGLAGGAVVGVVFGLLRRFVAGGPSRP